MSRRAWIALVALAFVWGCVFGWSYRVIYENLTIKERIIKP